MRFGRTPQRYKLKKDETVKSWLKTLCSKLNKHAKAGPHPTPEGVKYRFLEWQHGCSIVARPDGVRYQITITAHAPTFKHYGDIATVNVKSDEIFNIQEQALNRPYKVFEDGSVNLKGIHACVAERIKIIEAYKTRRAAERDAHQDRKTRLTEALEGSGVEVDFFGDRSGFHLKFEEDDQLTDLRSASFSGQNQAHVRLGDVYVPFEKMATFMKAYKALLATAEVDE